MRIEITVGIGSDKNNQPIDSALADAALSEIAERACRMFGGVTLLNGDGAWLNLAGILVTEECVVIRIDGVTDLSRANVFAVYVRDILNQSAVCLTIQDLNAEFFI